MVFLYDAYGGDPARLETHMRTHWPDLAVEYRDPSRGIDGVDACVASSWETAHVLATRGGTTPMHRLYFIQDFEPYFFPRGSHYALAAASYRLPFRRIALGGSIAEILDREVGVGADVVPFGCDRDVYRLLDAGAERSGVVFFARTGAPRRGYLVGMLALQEFHRRHPEQEIHLFGDPVASPPFPATAHGRLTPRELNALYNQTIGGLALSFTNVTLVAGEMLAAGNIPVANENAFARGGLRDDQVVWAEESPDRLAEALAAVVEHPDISTRAAAAAGGGSTTWADTQRAFAQIVEAELAQDLPGEAAVDLSPAGAALRQ